MVLPLKRSWPRSRIIDEMLFSVDQEFTRILYGFPTLQVGIVYQLILKKVRIVILLCYNEGPILQDF